MLNKHEEAEKHEEGKLQHHLMPREGYEEVLRALAFGADKYEPHGWAKGTKWSKYFDAALRHSWDWWWGETHDPESGLHPLAHAVCCLLFLIVYDKKKIGTDDRKDCAAVCIGIDLAEPGSERCFVDGKEFKKKSPVPIGGDA